jgi:hypothetical protein
MTTVALKKVESDNPIPILFPAALCISLHKVKELIFTFSNSYACRWLTLTFIMEEQRI